MTQKPFDESIVQMLMRIVSTDTVDSEQWCELIEITKVPKGHQEILDALKAFAQRNGFAGKGLPHYAAATRSLQEAMAAAKAGAVKPEPMERHHM